MLANTLANYPKTYFLELELENTTSAAEVVSKITKKLKVLIDYPEIGTLLSTKVGFETKYRFIVCEKYLAFYRFEDNEIYVDRIIYGRRGYIKNFFEDNNSF